MFNLHKRKEWIKICGESQPIGDIASICANEIKLIPCEITFLAYSQKYNLDNIQERFQKYRQLDRHLRKGNTLDNYILKYGNKIGTLKYLEKNNSTKQTLQNFIKKYGVEEGKNRYNILNSKKKSTEENFIKRYGDVIGKVRYSEFCKKCKGNHSLQRKIEKHGIQKGTELYDLSRKKIKFNNTIEGFVSRFGIKHGCDRYFSRQNKMLSATLHYKSASASSQKLFFEIYEIIKNDFKEIFFHRINYEYNIGPYFLDFYIEDNKKCIEYNGDAFHANPSIFKDTDRPHPFLVNLTAKEIQEKDKKRRDYIEGHNIKVLTIWHNEWLANKVNVIERCKKFLYE